MDWIDEAAVKMKKKNQVLFSKNSEYLQDLIMLFETQSHQVMALWAFEFAAESIAKLEEKYPEEKRPREALGAARDWAAGKIKMRLAQRKILDCHAFAKEIEDKEDIAICHSIGQACAVVHTAGHAIGYPIYDLTAMIYKYGIDNCRDAVERRKQEYIEKVIYWNEHLCDYQGEWADFMLKQSQKLPASFHGGDFKNEEMELREYISSDCEQLTELFCQTVHTVNAKDYSKEQLDAWTGGKVELQEWDRSFLEHYTIVAVKNGRIVGFGDMDQSGYLDRLYVHKDHQREGIASAICDKLEQQAGKRTVTTHASITARPFFEHRGYRVVRRQKVVRRGVELTNYVMEKQTDACWKPVREGV